MVSPDHELKANQRSFLGHVSVGVRSYQTSKDFYTAIFEPFGVKLVYDDPVRKILGYGFHADYEIFNVFERDEAHPPGPGTHLAFNAPNREAVVKFWEAGLSHGGKSNGDPGIREAYGEDYYAAFLMDPDGFRLEAVFQG